MFKNAYFNAFFYSNIIINDIFILHSEEKGCIKNSVEKNSRSSETFCSISFEI